MEEKVSKKDLSIICELDHNARQSINQIGQKTRLSPETVKYRINKLEENKIITGYHMMVDYNKLGLHHFKICIKFNGTNQKTEEEFYSKLIAINEIIWVAKCRGCWDSIISCTVNNIEDVVTFRNKIISLGNKIIADYKISILIRFYIRPRDFLLKKNSELKESIPTKEIELDKMDIDILNLLSKNSRQSSVAIANTLKTSPKTTIRRIKKLKDDRIIMSCRPILDNLKIGIFNYKVFIYLKDPNQDRFNELLKELKANPNMIICIKSLSNWYLEPELHFFNENQLYDLIQKLKNKFSDILEKIEYCTFIKEYK
jgi:Lrp/AsnC family leucine-responsive transcriptional regulator